MSYSATDLDRLISAFWRLADEGELRQMQALAADAFRGLDASQVTAGVTKAIQECEKPPTWAVLRRFAIEAKPTNKTGRIAPSMVVCIGKEMNGRRRDCNTAFPIGTWCPNCYPEKNGAANEYAIWSQSNKPDVESWEAEGHEAQKWYSSRDPRPGDNDPILTEPPHVTQAKLLAAEAAAKIGETP